MAEPFTYTYSVEICLCSTMDLSTFYGRREPSQRLKKPTMKVYFVYSEYASKRRERGKHFMLRSGVHDVPTVIAVV